MIRRLSGLLLVVLAVWLPPRSAHGQSRWEMMKDPEDGAFDMSAWLATAGGFLPVVSAITEPAVGYGGAVAPAFFHRPPDWSLEEARRQLEARERMAIPSISVAGGMYTESKSWGAFGGHLGMWRDGQLRYTGGLGLMSLNLSIAQDVPVLGNVLINYELEGWALSQGLRYKLGASDWHLGLRYDLLKMQTRIPFDNLPGVDPRETDSAIGTAGASVTWDTRNSVFTTDRGFLLELVGRRMDTALGGDFDYWAGNGKGLVWLDPIRELVIGARTEWGWVTEGVPFWAKPGVGLRGVASGRYTGDRTVTFEGEVRWDFARRWSLVGFGGAGYNHTDRDLLEDQTRWVSAGGGGFRYLMARAFGLRGGLDFAWGEDGFAFYVTMGSAWR
jgi:hypothetical protein